MPKDYTVLITGASSGIGRELAKLFAEKGYNLILVARNMYKLDVLKHELGIKRRDIKIDIIQEELAQIGAGQAVFEKVKRMGIEIDILINNAGAGYVGAFQDKVFEEDLKLIQLNIIALTELTKLFGAEMVKRKQGKILNVASTGSYHSGPYTAVYYATKAYVLSLSEALQIELKPFGITVSALCPGATQTEFSKKAGKKDAKFAMGAKEVAQVAFKGLMKRKTIIIPGLGNKLFVKIPRGWASQIVAKYQKSLYLK
ncbi:SDR family NAD(P)-dependent oxidoreductase [Cellulosilyticum sp. I15G10I2]|uniref:SDR family NAD(P)-dependent oxidoreductase n=1 Tax=Cellulosilyticum sp. I15G10I2 TaxID=1892843 RepID=UPI00085BCBCE|nr:SDR family oxidoreductase [Cellulosilyticum sp. I15G10I2]